VYCLLYSSYLSSVFGICILSHCPLILFLVCESFSVIHPHTLSTMPLPHHETIFIPPLLSLIFGILTLFLCQGFLLRSHSLLQYSSLASAHDRESIPSLYLEFSAPFILSIIFSIIKPFSMSSFSHTMNIIYSFIKLFAHPHICFLRTNSRLLHNTLAAQ
jgi:hypothetical protein